MLIAGVIISATQEFKAKPSFSNCEIFRSYTDGNLKRRHKEISVREVTEADCLMSTADHLMSTADHLMSTADHLLMSTADHLMSTADHLMSTNNN